MLFKKSSVSTTASKLSIALLSTLILAGCNSSSDFNSNPRNPLGAGPAAVSLSPSGGTAAPGDLSAAGNYVILGKTGVSTTGTSAITGNIGVSPAAASYITGFSLIADASNVFSTSSLVTGKVYAATYASPTPSNLTTAISNMETAYNSAAGRTPPDVTELGTGNIGGLTITPGLYKWGTTVLIPTSVTISGSATDVWIFQIAGDLTMSSSQSVMLSGGALPQNIFWQVAGQVTIGSGSIFKGIILSKTGIVFNTSATLDGRALAQTAVTLQSNTIKP